MISAILQITSGLGYTPRKSLVAAGRVVTYLGRLQTQSVAKPTARLNIVEGIFLTVLSCVCRADRTMTGHVLGHPSARPKGLAPERNLSPVVVGITRILMHCAMIEGACRQPQVC